MKRNFLLSKTKAQLRGIAGKLNVEGLNKSVKPVIVEKLMEFSYSQLTAAFKLI